MNRSSFGGDVSNARTSLAGSAGLESLSKSSLILILAHDIGEILLVIDRLLHYASHRQFWLGEGLSWPSP